MATPGAPGGTVIRPGDLDTRVTGQAAPQGAVGRRSQPTSRPQNPNVPRGMREWERPEPAVQPPGEGMPPQIPPQVPAPVGSSYGPETTQPLPVASNAALLQSG